MKGIEIPPRFIGFRFIIDTGSSRFTKVIFAPCLEQAVVFVRSFISDQGIDADWYFKEAISLSDFHVYSQKLYQCVLDL